jgi:hypothetical protein
MYLFRLLNFITLPVKMIFWLLKFCYVGYFLIFTDSERAENEKLLVRETTATSSCNQITHGSKVNRLSMKIIHHVLDGNNFNRPSELVTLLQKWFYNISVA